MNRAEVRDPTTGNIIRINLKQLTVELKVYHGNPKNGAASNLLKTLTESVTRNTVLFVLPSYIILPSNDERLAQIQRYSDHVSTYLEWAREVAVEEEERPQQFVISATALWGDQGNLKQLETEAETVADLGINTVQTADHSGSC